MKSNLLIDIFKIYEIEENVVNKNAVKCIFRAMKKNKLSYITGQYYNYDKDMFEYLLNNYKKLLNFSRNRVYINFINQLFFRNRLFVLDIFNCFT